MKMKHVLLSGCALLAIVSQPGFAKKIEIGLAIYDLRLERWQKDRDIFVQKLNRWVRKFWFNRPTVASRHKYPR